MALVHEIDVRIETGNWEDVLSDWDNVCKQSAKAVLENQWVKDTPAEVSIVLADDVFVQLLNKQYRGEDRPTNVLSFPAGGILISPNLQTHLGDIVLGLETCLQETREYCTDSAFSDHICHLVVHGVLHLLGYDHEIETEANTMGYLETLILEDLGVTDPYV